MFHRTLSRRGRSWTVWCLAAALALLASYVPEAAVPHANAASTGAMIADVNTDKAMYAPGQTATIYVDLKNNTGSAITNGSVTVVYKHLNQEVSPSATKTYSLGSGASGSLSFAWSPPTANFKGYLVEVYAKNASGTIIDNMNTAIDVSSTWTKFPRYGFLSNFGSMSAATTANWTWQLKNYHINALQYYDWMWKHHVPLAGTTANPAASWNDVANRPTYRSTIQNFISSAKGYNMANMNYNLIYGALSGYGQDGSGVNSNWGLFRNTNATNQYNVGLPSGWAASNIWFFNPADVSWQNYLIGRMQDVFTAYDFDGWHVDQIGDPGTVYTSSGASANLKTGFASMLNKAKNDLGKTVVFNNVGGYGLTETAASNVDVLYVETWEGSGQTTYQDLKNMIDNGRSLTNGSKQTVIAAYMNYAYQNNFTDQNPGYFNPHGVLRTNAAIFASGGSHIELGDDTKMLDHEYFPNHHLILSDTLKRQLRNYYDFLVAYENLLRDGQTNSSNAIQLTGVTTSTNGAANAVWTFAKSGGGYDVLHLINLLGQSSNAYRDTNADYPAPQIKTNIPVKYYLGNGTAQSVTFASPDYENGKSFDLAFTTGSDGGGSYIQFTVPRLEYWDMVYVKKGTGTGSGTNLATNGGFETGNLTGWTEWHPSGQSAKYGIDGNDVHSGSYKLYFWDGAAYQQSVHQLKTGLTNGSYTVKAWVKATAYGGAPYTCRMEVTGYGGADAFDNMTVDGTWRQYTRTVNVTNGQLDIGFYINSPGSTSMQIDDVELIKN